MTEEEILNAIADACKDDTLRFQIIIQENSLHVYINRPTQECLDYQQLKQRIYSTIRELSIAEFRQIWLYCRVLGETEPDWQSVLEIETSSLLVEQMTSMVEAITSSVNATDSIVSKIEQELEISESFLEDPQIDFEDLPTTAGEEEELFNLTEAELSELFEDSVQEIDQQLDQTSVSKEVLFEEKKIISDFSNYCFIRNRRLLYAVLDDPWLNIARSIYIFSRFEPEIQRSQLPVLEAYFEESAFPNLDNFAPKLQNWWREIGQLDSDNKHKAAIWLSRYCSNPQETITTIKEVLLTHITAANEQKAEKTEPKKLNSASPSASKSLSSEENQQLNQNIQVKSKLTRGLTMLWHKLRKTLNFAQTDINK